jgi:D-serine deaminase-like pyridoxal phosphate-dependent protein
MKFYEIDNALKEAIIAADKPIRLKIEIDVGGHFESVFEQDIIEANFYGLKEAAGGTSARGEIIINNEQRTMNNEQ